MQAFFFNTSTCSTHHISKANSCSGTIGQCFRDGQYTLTCFVEDTKTELTVFVEELDHTSQRQEALLDNGNRFGQVELPSHESPNLDVN